MYFGIPGSGLAVKFGGSYLVYKYGEQFTGSNTVGFFAGAVAFSYL